MAGKLQRVGGQFLRCCRRPGIHSKPGRPSPAANISGRVPRVPTSSRDKVGRTIFVGLKWPAFRRNGRICGLRQAVLFDGRRVARKDTRTIPFAGECIKCCALMQVRIQNRNLTARRKRHQTECHRQWDRDRTGCWRRVHLERNGRSRVLLTETDWVSVGHKHRPCGVSADSAKTMPAQVELPFHEERSLSKLNRFLTAAA